MVSKQQNPTKMLIILSLIFILPMLAAWLSYSKGMLLSGRQVNNGKLLVPPLQLETLNLSSQEGQQHLLGLRGKWVLLYFTPSLKDDMTRKNLYYMRQIRQATGKNRERIERAVVTMRFNGSEAQWLAKYFPGTYYFTISQPKLQQLQERLPKTLALVKSSLYLVDPHGNILLFYSPDVPAKGILKDLERVLKVSQIG